ncbi:MAG: hypothetical protein CL778_00605 [Chloroflexi bacterium]|nr:hypothetical protein [Chloroflexota bacterium]|tara:strand:+ start:6226 stop:6954 length:729 start_codon:yes stop_codon:yes gene_type:complete
MKIHRFYIPRYIVKNEELNLSDLQSKQIIKVLRMKKEDQVIIFNNYEEEWYAKISKIEKNLVFVIPFMFSRSNKKSKGFILAIGICKNNRFEFGLEKCTELGVKKIIPLITSRVQGSSNSIISNEKIGRWNKILIEASEQSNRLNIPVISNPISIETTINSNEEYHKFVMDISGEDHINKINEIKNTKKDICLFIGPPGGFTKEELEIFRLNKIERLSLGNNIFRTETAAIVSSFFLSQNIS